MRVLLKDTPAGWKLTVTQRIVSAAEAPQAPAGARWSSSLSPRQDTPSWGKVRLISACQLGDPTTTTPTLTNMLLIFLHMGAV